MNKIRGEVRVEIGGKAYVMRPTFTALCDIEGQLNNSVVKLVQRLFEGDVGVREMAVIVHAGIKASGGKTPPLNKIGDAVMTQGLDSFLVPIGEFLSAVFSEKEDEDEEDGGEDDQGEAEASPTP